MAVGTKTYRKVLSASTLSGDRVVNPQNESLGKIEDIMIDLETGRIAYCVLSFGGILGMGDKLFAIPWQALQLKPEEHAFVLDIRKEKLENAPGFDKDNPPRSPDQTFLTNTYNYYGYRGWWNR